MSSSLTMADPRRDQKIELDDGRTIGTPSTARRHDEPDVELAGDPLVGVAQKAGAGRAQDLRRDLRRGLPPGHDGAGTGWRSPPGGSPRGARSSPSWQRRCEADYRTVGVARICRGGLARFLLAYQQEPRYLQYYERSGQTHEGAREFVRLFLDQQQAREGMLALFGGVWGGFASPRILYPLPLLRGKGG